MKKIVLITGATSGFGKAIAEKFSENGYNCIITGRRNLLLQEIKDNLTKKYNNQILALNFDISKEREIIENISLIPEEWREIDILINNAGLALGLESFENSAINDITQMISTNINGVVLMTHQILPFMIKRKKGHIINIGSISGKTVYKNANIYCMTKHAIDAFSKGLRIDLLKHKIKVTAIHPGAADTEFSFVRFHGDVEKAKNIYQGYEPLHANDIANAAFFCAESAGKNVCIDDLVMTCLSQANIHYIEKEINN
jgi:3-hydroxy acid dehydrogenase/malonic semialdehyde reductase